MGRRWLQMQMQLMQLGLGSLVVWVWLFWGLGVLTGAGESSRPAAISPPGSHPGHDHDQQQLHCVIERVDSRFFEIWTLSSYFERRKRYPD
ncbi:Ff.00g110400.m01.CDS01 [Fusarium sp. VM40]|nr:Ff.00g110400.m01.CDS01 [Fusarium sp. VM40]